MADDGASTVSASLLLQPEPVTGCNPGDRRFDPMNIQETNPQCYVEHCDIDSSSDDYARRFAGAVGQWMLTVQSKAVLQLISPWKGGRVLDVGGGHAQLCGPLSDAGYHVTVLGSDPICGHRPRQRLSDNVPFVAGDIIDPPYPDGSFDVVVSIRQMAHVRDWPGLVRGLCRVARHAVVVDFATPISVNAIAPLLFAAKKKVEHNTRPFRLQRRGEVQRAFEAAGYNQFRHIGQFVAPMAMHRMANMPVMSRLIEGSLHGLGLGRLLGSPLILRATRSQTRN